METAQIQKIITDQFADPSSVSDLHKLLKTVAERQNACPDGSDMAHGSSFICNYIEQVPYMILVAWTSAKSVGLDTEISGILEMVKSYWIEDDDVIPDNLGVIGLLDDAYCSLSSMQAVSDLYRMQSGKHLFPDDLTAANRVMRKIIGEPYTGELDEIVRKAIEDADVKESVKLLASPEKQKLIESQATIWNHGPVSESPVSQLLGLGLTAD
jgi:uncharacterized membrane protein YkvA (DUF1232 family)